MSKRGRDQLEVAGIILDELSKGPMRRTPLMKEVLKRSPSPSSFNHILEWLLEDGYIERPERGLYQISERGLLLLKAVKKSE